MDDGPLFLEPRATFDPAIIGIVRRFNAEFVLYDEDKVIEIIEAGMDEGEYSWDEAREYYEFNVVGAWVGDGTPAFLTSDGIASWT